MDDVVVHLVAEEAAGDVDLLTANDDDLLAVQNLLGDDRGEATKQMALAVNDDGGGGEGRHAGVCRRRVRLSFFGCATRKFYGPGVSGNNGARRGYQVTSKRRGFGVPAPLVLLITLAESSKVRETPAGIIPTQLTVQLFGHVL